MRSSTIVWFRQDLRLRDNPALHAAVLRGAPIIPVYIWSPQDDGEWPPGAASRWWLHHSLRALDQELRKRGSRLILLSGTAPTVLRSLATRTGATAVCWNKRVEPAALACSRSVRRHLGPHSIECVETNGGLLIDPDAFLNRSGKPYQVYTAFQRGLLHVLNPGKPLRAPVRLRAPPRWPATVTVESLRLVENARWTEKLAPHWRPGESAAQIRLGHFLKQGIANYARARNLPSAAGTSRLSPHLHFGEIGPRQVWHALGPRGRHSVFVNELLWREFAQHLLHHFPHSASQPLRPEFARFPWRRRPRLLRSWQRGRTGIPLVDAGMRELWATGWMHNRVRMVTGSFLVKNLLIRWQDGARWFWDTLVDADLANNTLNWQWVAGSGADAAPYFRIFNPLLQARRFDPRGEYRKQWVPELRTGHALLSPIVDVPKTREAALEAYVSMRRAARHRGRLS